MDLAAALVTHAARLGRAVSRAATPDVPAATLRLLSLLDELGSVGVSQLAAADRCSQPTMSAAVQHLTERGWATKRANPHDARSALVDLTDTGRDVLHDARRRIGRDVAGRLAADPCHSEEDVAAALTLLQHLLPADHPLDQGVQ